MGGGGGGDNILIYFEIFGCCFFGSLSYASCQEKEKKGKIWLQEGYFSIASVL